MRYGQVGAARSLNPSEKAGISQAEIARFGSKLRFSEKGPRKRHGPSIIANVDREIPGCLEIKSTPLRSFVCVQLLISLLLRNCAINGAP